MRDPFTDAAEGTKSTKAAAGDDEQVDAPDARLPNRASRRALRLTMACRFPWRWTANCPPRAAGVDVRAKRRSTNQCL